MAFAIKEKTIVAITMLFNVLLVGFLSIVSAGPFYTEISEAFPMNR